MRHLTRCAPPTPLPISLSPDYWLIEAEGKAAEAAPIVLWLNGGPGSSSLIGLLTENGQLALNDRSMATAAYNATGVPSLFYNPHSWSRSAHMLYLEQPKGVGFSYCDAAKAAAEAGLPARNASALCRNDDHSTAADAQEFLVAFFAHFPEHAGRDFYITGESYAGTYIPMLVQQIDKHQGSAPLNFKGAAIGNGCWGSDCFYGMTEPQIDYHIFEGHAFIPQKLKAAIDLACSDFTDPSPQCSKLLAQSQSVPGDFNVYNMYDVCNGDDALATKGKAQTQAQAAKGKAAEGRKAAELEVDGGGGATAPRKGRLERVRAALRAGNKDLMLTAPADSLAPHPALKRHLGGALNDFVCGGERVMETWIGLPAVQKALHVDGTTGGMRYDANVGDITGVYEALVKAHYVLIYSGDVDACVPYWGTERFAERIGGAETEAWHAWKSDTVEGKGEIVAGYATSYKDFQFITVKGAGHMVPTFKPRVALTMFNKFIKGEAF